MTKEEKKERTKKILNNINELISKSIDLDLVGEMYPYELISSALTIYLSGFADLGLHSGKKGFELMEYIDNAMANIDVTDEKLREAAKIVEGYNSNNKEVVTKEVPKVITTIVNKGGNYDN